MSDIQEEIKEILNRAKNLKYKCDCCEEIAPGKYVMKDDKQIDNLIEAVYIIDKLLDYITNLQEENKKLKELCDKYEEEHNTTFIEWQKDIKANKKAIEYIETLEKQEAYKIEDNENGVPELKVDNEEYLVFCKYNKLLNILQGKE